MKASLEHLCPHTSILRVHEDGCGLGDPALFTVTMFKDTIFDSYPKMYAGSRCEWEDATREMIEAAEHLLVEQGYAGYKYKRQGRPWHLREFK